MSEAMHVRHFSPHTQYAYLRQAPLLAHHFGQSSALPGPERVRDYQLFLTNRNEDGVRLDHGRDRSSELSRPVTHKRGWDIEQVIPSPA